MESEPSQYYACSFIDNDDSSALEPHDISECPLERAERILKEQRRERRQLKRGATSGPSLAIVKPKRRRAIHTIDDSSDDDVIII